MKKPDVIRTPHLVLKALADGDRGPFLRLCGDAQIKKTYMLPDFDSAAQADAFFDRIRALSMSKERFVYGIYLGETVIGMLNDCGISGKKIELGYFIAPEHWNRGYASEALGAAVDELFSMGFETVVAGYFAENPASRRVMEKCGMRPLAEESVIAYRGKDHVCYFCGIAARDRENGNGEKDDGIQESV